MVRRYCFRAGLIRQGLTHDLSKYSPAEFLSGVKYFQGTRSPNAEERDLTGVSLAWLHHKGRNRHHYEYWIDHSFRGNGRDGIAGFRMPRRYVAEMIFDRVSACRVYQGSDYTDSSPIEYFEKKEKGAWFIDPVTLRDLEMLLTMWAEKGEEETIRYIRREYLSGREPDTGEGEERTV